MKEILPKDEELKDDGVGFHIGKTASYMKFAAINTLKKLGLDDLTFDQYEVLWVLIYNDGLYQRQLGKILIKDRPNITRLINILSEKGLIERRHDTENKRLLRVFITKEGRRKVDELEPFKEIMAKKVKSALTEKETESLISILIKLQDSLRDDFTMQT